ncbi:MAG TPA: antitoxin, partial [Methylomirabilota bacterium]|nr:antitoxin [Methylomirabilota bacterium]
MRTTVTLESDVVRRLREVSRVERLSFKEAINTTLRRGLDQRLVKPKGRAFHTVAEDMGVLPHLNYDNI